MHYRLPIRCTVPGVVACAAALLLACSPIQDNNGNIPIAESMEKIAPGKQTREQVKRTLGSPSAVGAFEENDVWYYIGKRTKTVAFLKPEVLEHQVVEIRFGADGRVSEVNTIDATQFVKPNPVDRVTPTEGNEFTILEQLIGNIGRFTPQTGQ